MQKHLYKNRQSRLLLTALKEKFQIQTQTLFLKQRTDCMDASGDLKRAKDYGNVVNMPMFDIIEIIF